MFSNEKIYAAIALRNITLKRSGSIHSYKQTMPCQLVSTSEDNTPHEATVPNLPPLGTERVYNAESLPGLL